MIRVNTYCLLKNESCDLHSTIVSFNLNPEPWLRLKDQEAKQKYRQNIQHTENRVDVQQELRGDTETINRTQTQNKT